MIKDIFRITIYLTVIISIMLIWSCQDDSPPSIYNENETYKPDPVITSISPDSAFAGVDTLNISGENFSTNHDDITVFFNGQKGVVVSSTLNQVNVIPASLISDSVKIQLSVSGSLKFAEFDSYKLKSAIMEVYKFEEYEKPFGVTTDKYGNIYFCMVSLDGSQGIKRLTTDGILEDFSPKKGESYYTDLKYGADDRIYGTWMPLKRAVFANAEGESAAAIPVPDNNANLFALDFDNNLNIWTGGLGDKIYRITPDGSDVKSFLFEPQINSIRFYNGDLYVAAILDSNETIWRFPIVSSDSLGAAEEYFNVSDNLPGYSVNTITFTSDGRLLMGTNAELFDENSLVVVSSSGIVDEWYPGVISGPVLNLAWDTGVYLYYVRGEVDEGDTQSQTILRVNMKTLGAPYYGRD